MTADSSGQGIDRGVQYAAADAVSPGGGAELDGGPPAVSDADSDAETEGGQLLQEGTPDVAADLAAARQDADAEA
ncbi:MAG: hypothetical protein M3P96_13890 [Actinomycetota bacterium]|nr:hypothetical protein [Actinomycetota bacterium]